MALFDGCYIDNNHAFCYNKTMRKGLSLYIHIPFCNSKCNYCSFVSMVAQDDVKNRYLLALEKEIDIRGKEFGAGYQVTSIYIGGGTPSCLPVGSIKRIMQTIYKSFVVTNDAEITIEVNPNSFSIDKLTEYLFAGVNRFSLGLQSANHKILKLMNRPDSVENFVNVVGLLRDRGISNISADVILGYPEQTIDDVRATINLLLKLNIPHISTYMLSVEDGTKLKTQIDEKELKLPSEDSVVSQYELVVKMLKDAGLHRYEVSNFAKDGFKSRHNQVYWKRWNYLGLGLSAHSYLKHQRFANTSDLATYIGFLEKSNRIPVCDSKMITDDEAMEECVMLSLRTADGLNLDNFLNEFKINFVAKNKAKLTELIKGGYLIINPKTNCIQATDKGFLVLNKIISDLV